MAKESQQECVGEGTFVLSYSEELEDSQSTPVRLEVVYCVIESGQESAAA